MRKFNHGGSTKQEYFAYWDRYINFLESIGLIVTGFNPDFDCYFKKDEYLEDGVRKYNANLCVRIPLSVVKLMMELKEKK